MPTSAIKGSIWDFSNFSEEELKSRLSDKKDELNAIEDELLKRKTDDIIDKVDQLRQLWTEISAAGVEIKANPECIDIVDGYVMLNTLKPYTDVVFDVSNIRR
jgi:hypothetical protein